MNEEEAEGHEQERLRADVVNLRSNDKQILADLIAGSCARSTLVLTRS